MKKSILYTAILAIGLASCSDFLTEEPVMSQSNELTLSAYDGLNSATAGLYNRFQSYSWYGANFVLSGELSGGNARNPFTYPGSGRYRTQTNWSYNDQATMSVWSYGYYTIAAANNVINSLDGKAGGEVSQQDIDNLMAEALFIRALCYFDLVNVYAMPYTYNNGAELGVPVVLVTENGQPARETVAKVYEQIVSDLTTAENLMSDSYRRSGVTDAGAVVTKPAIQALLSRVYLYMGEYQKCADYATKVIDCGRYNLLSGESYVAMFTQQTAVDGDEVIFEMYSSNKNAYWDGSGWEHMSYVTGYSDDNTGSADVCASEDLINLFTDPNDVRLNLYELKNNTDWFCRKYAGKEGSAVPKENNTIIIRLSEMYLNRAEALYNGATISGASADGDLRTLAAQRGTTAPAATETNILTERRKELAFEGHIFFDLKRTQQGVTRTDDAGVDMPFGMNWALPIPKSECDANPNIEQNEF